MYIKENCCIACRRRAYCMYEQATYQSQKDQREKPKHTDLPWLYSCDCLSPTTYNRKWYDMRFFLIKILGLQGKRHQAREARILEILAMIGE